MKLEITIPTDLSEIKLSQYQKFIKIAKDNEDGEKVDKDNKKESNKESVTSRLKNLNLLKSFGRKAKEEEENKGDAEAPDKENEDEKADKTKAEKSPDEEDSSSPRDGRGEDKTSREDHAKISG